MNKHALQGDWEIAILLSRQPKVVRIQKDALAFDFEEDHFEDIGLGYHNGFYDFLRGRTGAIVGIRYFPSDEAAMALTSVPESEATKLTKAGEMLSLLIFWGIDRHFNEEIACDQYFGNNFIYRSKRSGMLAIGFGIDILSTEEIASIEKIGVHAD